MRTIHDYNTAVAYWSAIKPIRRRADTNERPIDKRRATHKTIRQLEDGSIACSLHGTDVVVYHPDGDLTITGYCSVTTTAFANLYTPKGIRCSFGQHDHNIAPPTILLRDTRDPNASYWGQDEFDRFIFGDQTARVRCVDGIWRPVHPEKLEPFTYPELDKVAARALLKEHPLNAFLAWCDARESISPGGDGKYHYFSPVTALNLIEGGPEQWTEAWEMLPRRRMTHWSAGTGNVRIDRGRSDTGPQKLRVALYHKHGAIRMMEAKIVDWAGYKSIASKRQRYQAV